MTEPLLNRDDILAATAASSVATRDVTVPELGGRKVRIREMSGALRNRVEAAFAAVKTAGDSKPLEKVTAQILAACIVDGDNRPILKEVDAKTILARNPRAAFRIRENVFAISAIDDDDMESLTEGFDEDQSDDSTSD